MLPPLNRMQASVHDVMLTGNFLLGTLSTHRLKQTILIVWNTQDFLSGVLTFYLMLKITHII